jgi:hypothetical protein
VLEATASAYRECVDPSYIVSDHPDRRERTRPEVDGILTSPSSRPVAIEITRIETFAGQLRDKSLAGYILRAVERQLAVELPFGVTCAIPANAFDHKFDWPGAARRIADHIRSIVSDFYPGGMIYDLPGVPFPVQVCYEPDSPLRFHFFRLAPSFERISSDVVASMEEALRHKKPCLAAYATRGYRTALVVESSDPYLLTYHHAYAAFCGARETVGSEHVADVLFAITCECNFIYCMSFQGDPAFRNALNRHDLKFGSEHERAGSDALTSQERFAT